MIKKKQTVKRASLSNGLRIPQIKHGSTTITLEDVNTGEKKVYHDDNMQTNGINEFLKNCGWLNRDNLDKDNLMTQLLGGVMLFNTPITEDADIVKVPSGERMIANSYIGASNLTQEPSELGSFLPDQSGWDANHKVYTAVYHWLQAQGNCTQETGPIQCVCACPQSYGMCGEGNITSGVRYSSKANMTSLSGTRTSYSGIPGYIFGISLERSTCYSFDLTDKATTGKGILRKYRLPISKINLAGTTTLPVKLPVEYDQSDDPVYDKEITLPEAMQTATLRAQPYDGKLLLWNLNYGGHDGNTWGNGFTQYLWTLEDDGTLTSETLLNTSGTTLYGIQTAYFDGGYCFFPYVATVNYRGTRPTAWLYTTKICIMNLDAGTIDVVDNEYGHEASSYGTEDFFTVRSAAGWMLHSSNGDGRIITVGSYPMIVDKSGDITPTNASTDNIGTPSKISPLILSDGLNLYRDQAFISTINNLSEPVTKDPSKAMTVQYRFEFEDDDLWDVEEAQND